MAAGRDTSCVCFFSCFHGFDPLQPPRGITPCRIGHLSKLSWPNVNTVYEGFNSRALDLAGVRGELSVFPKKDKQLSQRRPFLAILQPGDMNNCPSPPF